MSIVRNLKLILFFYFFINLLSSVAFGAIVINEIMYNPTTSFGGTSNEWVELYNPTTESINLTGWVFRDKGSANTSLSGILQNNSYLIIADNATKFNETYNCSCTVIDGSLGLSNTGDTIWIFNSSGAEVDTLTYDDSWGGDGNNKTLERIDPSGTSNTSTNWANSNINGGTPVQRNSVTPLEHDLAIYPENITFFPQDPSPRTGVNISVTIQNNGISNETNINISLYNISDSTLTLIHSQLSNITKQSSTSLTVKWNNTLKGNSTILVRIENFTDDNTTNNNATKNITFDFHLVINEIMYNPPGEIGSDADFEWVEIYNNASYTENLTGWVLQCDSTSKSLTGNLTSNSYLIFAKDRTQFYTYYSSSINTESQTCSFNNDGDTIKLIFNNSGIYHEETVSYSPSWGADGTGYTLEKINPSIDNNSTNWAESKAYGGTPGARNNPDNKIKSSLATTTTSVVYRTSTEVIYSNKSETPDYKIISFPELVYVSEPFKTIVSLRSNEEQIVTVYSYVYDGRNIISQGFDGSNWKGTWTANKKDIKIGPTAVYVELENKIEPNTSSGRYQFKVRIKDKTDLTQTIEVLPERIVQAVETDYSEDLNIDCEQVDNQVKITVKSSTQESILLLHFSKKPTVNETLYVNRNLTYTLNLEDDYNSIIFVENNKILKTCEFYLQKSSQVTGRTTQVISIDKIATIIKSWLEKLSFLSIFRSI